MSTNSILHQYQSQSRTPEKISSKQQRIKNHHDSQKSFSEKTVQANRNRVEKIWKGKLTMEVLPSKRRITKWCQQHNKYTLKQYYQSK